MMVLATGFRVFVLGVLHCGVAYAAPQWISGDTASPEKAAPMLEKMFDLSKCPRTAVFDVAIAGWGEVWVNGEKVGKDVLSPVTCQPDKRLSSIAFDITSHLRPGRNTIGVLLGNGWFNAFTKTVWKFDEAPWINSPMIKGTLFIDGNVALETGASWKVYDSPVIFNSLRNGESYDARMEGRRTNERIAKVEKYAPWGVVSPEDAVPCREFEAYDPIRVIDTPDGNRIYDFGVNIAGWCEIAVCGNSGAKIVLDYDESVTATNTLLGHIGIYLSAQGEKRPVQHDEYILAGRHDGEKWHPRFTYHGFRFVKVTVEGDAILSAIRARFVRSAFPTVGRLEVSDRTFAALQSATMRSYLSNFVGIPTDCPHREKNGWTGDAQQAMETGLWNFGAKEGYVHFLRMIIDAQLPNGGIPCIVPCSPKFGYSWGTGPAWDAALFELPWQIYRFYGDDEAARAAYPAMKRYLAFIGSNVDSDGLLQYGLGDWCSPGRKTTVPVRLTDSAFLYHFNRQMAFWADHFGDDEFANVCRLHAESIRNSFNRVFYKGGGVYAGGELTSLAAPLYFDGLCVSGEEKCVVERLVQVVRDRQHRADFGVLGAKWVPRVLAKNGYADDAWRIFTQPNVPGWAAWLKTGDGTLQEDWDGANSHNHIMFGDLSAWAYQYLAGIDPVKPGMSKIRINPHYIDGLESVSAMHLSPYGEIKVEWHRENGVPILSYSVPEGVEVLK